MLLALQALGDVARHADDFHNFTGVGLANRAAGRFKPAAFPTGMTNTVAVGQVAILLERTAKTRYQRFALLRMKQAVEALAPQLLRPNAEHVPGRRGCIDKPAIRAVARDQISGVLDDQVIQPPGNRRLLLVLQPACRITPTHPNLCGLRQRDIAPEQMAITAAGMHILYRPLLPGSSHHKLGMIVRQPGRQLRVIGLQLQQGGIAKHRLARRVDQHHW